MKHNDECWCKGELHRSSASACGYSNDYAGTYYKIENSKPFELINKLGFAPNSVYCTNENNCTPGNELSCRNVCSPTTGCYGTGTCSSSSWPNNARWTDTDGGHYKLARCTNFELGTYYFLLSTFFRGPQFSENPSN